ncbi:MAG: hypothetical protein ACP5IO_06105 [Elusimicrobiales bacterium]
MRRRTLKRYKPKRRVRLKLTIASSNRFLIFLSYLVIVLFLIFSVSKYSSRFAKIGSINLTSSIINRIVVDSSQLEIKDDIEKILSLRQGSKYSKDVEKAIKDEILEKYPFLEIKTSFNPVTGVMKIKASIMKAIARFDDNSEYLFDDLSIRKKAHGDTSSLPIIKIHNKDKETLETVKSIIQSEFYKIANQLTISETNQGFIIEYPQDLEILINRDFKYRKEDFEKIKEVIMDARSRFSLPLRIDARFVDSQRIIVKTIENGK